jgi:hypothetical protein
MRLPALVLILSTAAIISCTDADSITSPTPDPQASPTVTFESVLYPNGSASRGVPVSTAGTLTVTLDTVSPPASIGLALGLARAGCYMTASIEAAVTPAQLTSAVDPGNYCVHVFDVGQLAREVAFSVTITKP